MAVENPINQENPNCLKLKTFYNKYFPRDEYTYRLRIPFIGLILSALSIGFISNEISRFYFRDNPILLLVYAFAAFGVGYELHYGLKTRDHHQFTPWLILKFVEIFLGIITVLVYLFEYSYLYHYAWDLLFYESIVIGLNLALTLSMFKKAQEYEKLAAPEKLPLQETDQHTLI